MRTTAVAQLCRGCRCPTITGFVRAVAVLHPRAPVGIASVDSNAASARLSSSWPMRVRRLPGRRQPASIPHSLGLFSRCGTQQTEPFVELLPATGRHAADVPTDLLTLSLQIASWCISPVPTTGFILSRLKNSTALWHPSSKMDLWTPSQRACPCRGSTTVDRTKAA